MSHIEEKRQELQKLSSIISSKIDRLELLEQTESNGLMVKLLESDIRHLLKSIKSGIDVFFNGGIGLGDNFQLPEYPETKPPI